MLGPPPYEQTNNHDVKYLITTNLKGQIGNLEKYESL